jgi:hypothetical protein
MITVQAKSFLSDPFAAHEPHMEEEVASIKERFGLKSIDEQITLSFNLAGVILDFIYSGIENKIILAPTSPKLRFLQDRELSELAQKANNMGDFSLSYFWVERLDEIFLDEEKFTKIIVHGEIQNTLNDKGRQRSIPMNANVIQALPEIRDGILLLIAGK